MKVRLQPENTEVFVICKQCGTEIAYNALICFRCGRATAEPRVASPTRTGTRTRARIIALLAAVLVIATSIALRKTVSDQTTRIAIGIVEVVFIAILAFRVFRSR